MKFNEKLYELRKTKGLSQEELGEKINVSRQTVSKWETGQTTPELEKLIELSEIFDLSVDELVGKDINNEIHNTQQKSNKKKICFKILIIIVVIYLLISIYKLIGLTRFYLITNSFNEENYWMTECRNISTRSENMESNYSVTKIGNEIRLDTSNNDSDSPYNIEYIKLNEKTAILYHYNEDTGKYTIQNRLDDFVSEQEVEEYFNLYSQNYIKEYTLSLIPSDIKSILLSSLNPFCNISLINREIRYNYIWSKTKVRICLSHDYLVEKYYLNNEYDNYDVTIDFSYDYVQDHFDNRKSIDPKEEYIIYEEK